MPKETYAQLQRRIEALSAQAQKVRATEKVGVIAKIKAAITAYDISPQELFGNTAASGKKSKSKFGQAARYSDGNGNTWVGRGPRPEWLRNALAAGKQLEDFEAKDIGAAGPEKTVSRMGAKKAEAPAKRAGSGVRKDASTKRAAKPTKKVVPVKYKDDAGNAWSGRGSQPRWLREALAAGKKLEELLA